MASESYDFIVGVDISNAKKNMDSFKHSVLEAKQAYELYNDTLKKPAPTHKVFAEKGPMFSGMKDEKRQIDALAQSYERLKIAKGDIDTSTIHVGDKQTNREVPRALAAYDPKTGKIILQQSHMVDYLSHGEHVRSSLMKFERPELPESAKHLEGMGKNWRGSQNMYEAVENATHESVHKIVNEFLGGETGLKATRALDNIFSTSKGKSIMTDIVQGHGFGLDAQVNRFMGNKFKDPWPNVESMKESQQKLFAQINDISDPEMKSAMMERMGAKPLDVSMASLFQRMKTDPLMHKDVAFPDSGEIQNPWLKKYDKIQSKLSGLLGPNGEPLTLQERQIMDYKNKYSTFMQPTVQKHGMLGASGNIGQLQALQSPAIQEQTQQFLEQSKVVEETTDKHKEHGNGLKNLLTRYFGITAIIHLAKRAFQEMLKQIKENSAAFRTFERNMANVSTIVGDTKENMGSLTAGVALMSKTFGKDANDVAKGLYDILSAAVKVEDSLQLLYISGKAAVAGLTDMKTAVNVMVSVMNSYGYSVNQMAHASDVLFAGVVRGVFTFEQFESSLGYLIPIAAQVGISLEEIVAAVSTATRFGQHIDSVTRGLALSIQNIISPSQKAAKAAEKLGIDLSELGLSSKGLIGFFADLKEKVDGSNTILSDIIPNMRSFRVAMILAGTGAEGAALDFDIMNSSVDATDVAFNKVAATVAFTKDQITQYVAEVKRMVGETQVDLDFMGDKWDLFVTKLTGRFMKAFNPVDIGIGLATLGGSFLVGLEQTAIESSEMVDKVIKAGTARRKQAWEDQQEEYDLTDPFIEKETFYQQLMKGQDVDLSGFQPLKALYDAQEKNMTDFGTFYNKRSESILLKDKDMFIGSLEDEIAYYKELGMTGAQEEAQKRYDEYTVGQTGTNFLTHEPDTAAPKTYKEIDWTKEADNLVDYTLKYQNLEAEILTTKEAMAPFYATIDDAKLGMEKWSDQIDLLTSALKTLKEEIGEIGDLWDGTIGKELAVAVKSRTNEYMSHWVDYAIKDVKYQTELENKIIEESNETHEEGSTGFEWYTDKMSDAIKVIRAYNAVQKEAVKETKEFNFALAENALRMKEIEYIGMLRRRGNTRAEQRLLKRLSIERTKLEIDQARKDLARQRVDIAGGDGSETSYQEAMNYIQSIQDAEAHALWLTQDARQKDIDDLITTIHFKEGLYTEYSEDIITAHDNMALSFNIYKDLMLDFYNNELPSAAQIYLDTLEEIMQKENIASQVRNGEITVEEGNRQFNRIDTIKDYNTLAREYERLYADPSTITGKSYLEWRKKYFGFEKGTNYVPSTGLYQLHRGEAVIPANQNRMGNTVVINVTGNTIDQKSEQHIAELIGSAVQRGLLNANGTSKYRVR